METTEIIFENVLAYNDSVKKQRMKDSCVSTWHKVELSERGNLNLENASIRFCGRAFSY